MIEENEKDEETRREEEPVDYLRNLIICLKDTGRFIAIYWKIIFAVVWPMFLLPFLLIYDCSEVRCAYVVLIMAGYWVTDCFPMAVTALIPVVMFPALGVLSTMDVATCYMNDTIMVFLGGLILAISIEHSNLHLRIALGVMRTVGCSHANLLGGFCVVTTFISMWITNTAATALMIPIIFAVLRELEQAGLGAIFKTIDVGPGSPPEIRPTKITRAYLLVAAYCSSIGGTGTLVGTGTNLTFKGIYESIFPDAEPIIFTDWMVASLPQMIVNSFLTWLYVRIAFLGFLRPRSKDAQVARIGREGEAVAMEVIQQRYKNLGPISCHETGVATLFILCVFLWLFRKPGFIRGWSELLTDVDLRDSMPVMLVSILMFFIPKDLNFIHSYSKDPKKRPTRSSEGLITWKVIEAKMPWSLMFLLGGGFAISRGSVASCMARRVGEALVPLRYLPPVLILAVVCLFEGFLTEFTSNVGVANITLPVIAEMCVAMEIHPMYLMIPATLMCSFSFRLPVGTPPNAIVAIAGHIPTGWLIAGGCAPSIYAWLVEVLFFPTWGVFVYGIRELPDWVKRVQPDNDTDAYC